MRASSNIRNSIENNGFSMKKSVSAERRSRGMASLESDHQKSSVNVNLRYFKKGNKRQSMQPNDRPISPSN